MAAAAISDIRAGDFGRQENRNRSSSSSSVSSVAQQINDLCLPDGRQLRFPYIQLRSVTPNGCVVAGWISPTRAKSEAAERSARAITAESQPRPTRIAGNSERRNHGPGRRPRDRRGRGGRPWESAAFCRTPGACRDIQAHRIAREFSRGLPDGGCFQNNWPAPLGGGIHDIGAAATNRRHRAEADEMPFFTLHHHRQKMRGDERQPVKVRFHDGARPAVVEQSAIVLVG